MSDSGFDKTAALVGGREPEYWHCDDCNEVWIIVRGNDGWDGRCPTCEAGMEQVDASWWPEDAEDDD